MPVIDLVAAEFFQALGHERGRPVHLIEELRMGMKILPPGSDIGLQVGDAINDGHERNLLEGCGHGRSRKSRGQFTIKLRPREEP